MKHKVSELTGAQLDLAVGLASGMRIFYFHGTEDRPAHCHYSHPIRDIPSGPWEPSTDWMFGGPIIERERISLTERRHYWVADLPGFSPVDGPTPLIAAMRAYVASKLGDTVEIPQ